MVFTEFKIAIAAHTVATMLVLIIGKVVLVVNKLSILRRFDDVSWRLFAFGQNWIFALFVVYTTAVEVITLFGPTPGQLFSAFFRYHPAKMLVGEQLWRSGRKLDDQLPLERRRLRYGVDKGRPICFDVRDKSDARVVM